MTISTARRVAATPAARRRAAELDVVLTEVIPAGHGIRVRDVDKHKARSVATAPTDSDWLTNALEVDMTGVEDVLTAVERSAIEALRTHPIAADPTQRGSLTVSHFGRHGAVFGTPLPVRGQAAVLGVGAVVRRPVVVRTDDDQEAIGIRPMAHLVLTYDHRLVDDADAGRFLTAVGRNLHTEDGPPT